MSKKNPNINWVHWKNRKDLTPQQGALLAYGIDPNDTQGVMPWGFSDQILEFSEYLKERSIIWTFSKIEDEREGFQELERQSKASSVWSDRLVKYALAIKKDNSSSGRVNHLDLMRKLKRLLDDHPHIADNEVEAIIDEIDYKDSLKENDIVNIVIEAFIKADNFDPSEIEITELSDYPDGDTGKQSLAVSFRQNDDPYGWKASAQSICDRLREQYPIEKYPAYKKNKICGLIEEEMKERHSKGETKMTGRSGNCPKATTIGSKEGIKW